MSETAQFHQYQFQIWNVLQIPLLNQAEGDWGLSLSRPWRDLTLVSHTYFNQQENWSTPALSPWKDSQKQLSQSHQPDASLHLSLFSLPPSPLWNQDASDLPATTTLCMGQVKLQMPAPGVGHLSFRGHSLRSHKIATAVWAKHVSSLTTQDSFSKSGFVFQAPEILRCHQHLTATYRAPFCVTTGTQEPFLGLWAETVADWHFWLGSLKSPLLFLIALII